MRSKIVVFTGAGVSADSGISTFRDSDGLWANYRIEEVCTPEALQTNRAKVVEFYNMRRRESLTKQPNAGHLAIASMQEWADVEVVTQNVDNLHEQAGSKYVLHLHGELMKLRSECNWEEWCGIASYWCLVILCIEDSCGIAACLCCVCGLAEPNFRPLWHTFRG